MSIEAVRALIDHLDDHAVGWVMAWDAYLDAEGEATINVTFRKEADGEDH